MDTLCHAGAAGLGGSGGFSDHGSKPASSRCCFFHCPLSLFHAAAQACKQPEHGLSRAPRRRLCSLHISPCCMKKQVFEGLLFCFHSPSPCFFKFFVVEKSLNFTGKLDPVMSGLASAALPRQTSHRARGGSSPMEPAPRATRSSAPCLQALKRQQESP